MESIEQTALLSIIQQLKRRIDYVAGSMKTEKDKRLLKKALRTLDACQTLSCFNQIIVELRNLPSNNPLQQYAASLACYDSPILSLEINPADLSKASCGDIEPVQLLQLDKSKELFAFYWGFQALLAWENWVPKIDKGLFEILFQEAWNQTQNDKVDALLEQMLHHEESQILVLRFYTGVAYLTDAKTLQSRFYDIFEFCDDFVFLPLTPKPAEWIISYFHHNFLEIGFLKEIWLHKVVCNTGLTQ